jgi:transposase-like protein
VPVPRDTYTKAFRRAMVAKVKSGETVAEVAEANGINWHTLKNWIYAANQKARKAARVQKDEPKPVVEDSMDKANALRDKALLSALRDRCATLEDMVIRLTHENLALRGK